VTTIIQRNLNHVLHSHFSVEANMRRYIDVWHCQQLLQVIVIDLLAGQILTNNGYFLPSKVSIAARVISLFQ